MTVRSFLREHIAAMGEVYDVTVVANTGHPSFLSEQGINAKVVPVGIERAISPWRDIKALLALWRLFRRERFDIVHSVTPKAGLLAMLAGRLAAIRFRIHIFTGQVWATRRGFSRWLLKSMDRLLAASATHLLADSFSQRQFLVEQQITSADKLGVLADGSISGVDLQRFRPNGERRVDIRKQLQIGDGDLLLLFLGRLNRDKGVIDLAAAFARVADDCPQLHLLLVGPDEAGIKAEMTRNLGKFTDRTHFVDYTDRPESYFAAADIFCLPSYREGFGSVIIEAAACGMPAIGSRIYGISDAIREGETGLLFPAGDVPALATAIRRLAGDPSLRKEMGVQAMQRAQRDFPVGRLVQAWLDYYDGLK